MLGVVEMKEKKKWYKSVSNWLNLIACIILVPILILNIWIMIQAKTNKDEIPSVFGYKPFIVLSGSMETKIHKGDLIITKKVKPETLKENDIIAFRDAEGTVTTHRIIDIVEKEGETYFITKGDNNNKQDQNLVSYGDVEGIYVLRIPGMGSMMDFLAQPTTIIIIVLGITILFGIGFSISTRKQRAEERKEFLEYKRMKEEEQKQQIISEKDSKKSPSKKKSSKKD